MKKVVIAAVILVVLAVGLLLARDSMIERAVEAAGKHALEVDTDVASASAHPFSGELELSEIEIANPPGFSSPYFANLGEARTSLKTTSLFSDTIEVRSIELSRLRVNLERNQEGTNFGQLLASLKRFEKDKKGSEEEKKAKKLVIGELVLRDVQVHSHMLPALGKVADAELILPELRLTNLGGEDGITLSQLVARVVEAVLASSVKLGVGVLPAEMLKDIQGSLEDLGQGILDGLTEDLLPSLQKIGTNVGEGARDAAGKLGGQLEKIFK